MPATDAEHTEEHEDQDPGAAAAARARQAELEGNWRRALADLDNFRKRCAREVDQARSDERARVAAAFLPVVDNLEMALSHAGADPAAIVEGVRSVRDQAVSLLAALGFPRHDAVGQPFDPARHEAVTAMADTEAEPGTILHVLRPGYGGEDRQLRPASVVVATRGE
jgi:molecular chaperone GrpE